MSNNRYDACPKCGLDFNGEDIYQLFLKRYTEDGGYQYAKSRDAIRSSALQYPQFYSPLPDLDNMSDFEVAAWDSARSYGWTFENPKCFRKEIGIELREDDYRYDGVALWECPECHYRWKRFDDVPDKYLSERIHDLKESFHD